MTSTDVEPKRGKVSTDIESDRSRFLRLAPDRVRKALRRIHLVGNLGSAGYESTDNERDRIISTIFNAVHEMKRRIEGHSKKVDEFDL